MSRGGLRPLRSRSRTTARVIASMSFMSTAPRPHTQPSAISPEKGWWVQSAALAGTTSVWPWMSSAGRDAVLALDPGHRGGAALVRLEDLRLQPHLGELLGDVLGRLALARARVVAVVAGVDPDQVAAEVDDLVLAGDAVAASVRARLAHAASSHCRRWWSPASSSPVRPPHPKARPRPVTPVHAATGR